MTVCHSSIYCVT